MPAAPGLLLLNEAASSAQPARQRLLLDDGWHFIIGDPAGAESASFDAGAWRSVDLPHDWSIEGKRGPREPMGGGGGFFPAGVGWYRRTFTAAAAWNGKRLSIEFEGVYMNATVYLNGRELGMHPYGYTTFHYDLTPHLKPGGWIVLEHGDLQGEAVRVLLEGAGFESVQTHRDLAGLERCTEGVRCSRPSP